MPKINQTFMKLAFSSVIPYINEKFAKKLNNEVAMIPANIHGSQLNRKSKCLHQKSFDVSEKRKKSAYYVCLFFLQIPSLRTVR